MGFVKSGRDARGFSTVELMVTILLVGILAAIVVPKMLGPRTEAKNTEAKSSLQTGFAAARSYLADNRSYANLCANESNSCNNKISLHALSQQIPNSELRGDASPRDSLDARPGALWMGSSTGTATDNGVDPEQNTLVLCSLTEGGDTIFCIKDDKGVISYAKVVDENQTVEWVVRNATFATNTDLNGNAIASTTADDTAPADANVDSAPVNKTLPVVTASDGTAVGDQLTGSPGSWSGNPIPTYSFSWKRCNSSGESCQFIAGADNSVYTLVTGDIGSRLKLSVLAENSVAPEATAESLPSSLVEEPASTQSSPSNTSDPYISGQTIVGSTLVINPGQWSGSPDPEFSYTWRRCDFSGSNCIAISGATGSSYLLEGLDASTTIRVRVTASNSEGSSSVITAARGPISSLPVNVVSPSITGSIVRGELLAADPGSWSGYPEPTYAFQWQRCDSAGANCQSIDGQTESSYTVSAGDTGRTLRLKTTASNVAGSVSAYSAPTSGVQGTPENTTAPSISGSAVMDQTLTASEGSWTGTPSPSYSYQWQRCDIDGTNCSNIISASDNTYKVQRVDGAKRLQVRVTAQNTNGASSSTSDQTSAAKTPPLNLNRPVLSGSVAMDEQLSTTDGSWDGYEASTYSYQWERCDSLGEDCSAISDQTGKNHTISDSDANHTLRAKVTAENSVGSAVAYSATSDLVVNPPVNQSLPLITGIIRVGQTLTGTAGGWSNSPYGYAYQWQRCFEDLGCRDIPGATSGTYLLQDEDTGLRISLLVIASNSSGSAQASSEQTEQVLRMPLNTEAPSISGTSKLGETLQASEGKWTAYPAPTYAYQWQRCNSSGADCVDIDSASSSSYTLTADDVSKKLKVKVTAQNSEGQGSATSAASEIIVAPPANVALPVLSGSFKVGELVNVSDGSWSGYPTPEIEYQWRRCDGAGMSCVDINGATLASYTLVSADAGKTIRALLTATNSSGSDSVSSSASDRVTQTPASTAPPTVTGTAQVGSTLSSSDGLWEAYPEVSFSYQWQVSSNGTSGWTNATGPGATSVSYTIPSADAGKYLKIKITAENSAGSASAYSAVSSQVTMIPAPVSPPVITGSAVTGSTLNASSGSWDGFPSPAYSYQWQVSSDGSSGWTSAAGAGNGTNTYIIPTADAGKYLRVQVAATNSVGSETAYSAASGLVLDKPTNTVLPTMSGTMITGSVAAATSGSWTGTPAPTYSYLWQVSTDGSTGWTTASGSGYNTASYTIGSYTGKYLRVQVTATNSADSVVAYSASDRVLGIACSSAPVVSGTARTSLTLSSSAPDCSGSYPAVSVAYQWQVSSNGSTSWASATGTGNDTASYTIPTSDAGKYLRVKATATNSAGSVQVYSTSTSPVIDRPVNTVLPAMSGSMIYNTTQAASSGSWTGTPAPSYTYQWQISDDGSTSWTSALGAGNNTASYTIGNYASYLGKYLRVEVTAANTAGSVSAYSSSSRIIGLNNSSLPTVTGLAQVGKVLSSSSGDWSSSYPTPAYTYQWQVSNNGSTSWISASGTGNATASYTVVSADVGKYLRVQVTATNSAGSDIAHSASTDSVTAAPVNTSLPSLSGTTTDGQTLTASSGSWTGSPTPTYTYQWQVASAATGATWTSATGAGATTTDYVIAVIDVGKYLRVQVTATNSADSVIANSSASAAIAASIVVPANTVLPVVSGTASTGQTLTASSGTWTGRPTPTYAYQWQVSANGTDGWTSATGTGNSTSSYTISEVDAGKYLRVQVTATNSVGSADAASVATLSITAAPINTVAPAVSGAANAGSALTASSGSWTGTPTPTYAYQWQVSANGTTGWTSASGTGNTTASHTVATADAGKYLRVQVTATNSVSPVTAVSAATAAVTAAPANTALPSVSGAAVAGSALTASSGSWVGFPTPTYAYQWQVSANGTDGWTSATGTGNATSAYTVAIADAGNYLRIQVTASNGIGSPATAHSQAFVIPTPPVNTVLPVVTGTTTPSSTLTATTGTWTGNPAPTYSYQWQRCDLLGSQCTDVGTSSSTYTLVNADAAYTIKVQVTASNVAGSVAASSTATSVIASSAGCTLTTSGGYTIHTCTTVGSSTINTYRTLSADYLVVGGGGAGGGGDVGGGGGAGGFRTNATGFTSGGNSTAEASMSLTSGAYAISVGAGGTGVADPAAAGGNGGSSSFNGIVSLGGGGGAGWTKFNGNNGGSGGASVNALNTPGTGAAGQGTAGGRGLAGPNYPQGGGGGAGQAGQNALTQELTGRGGSGLPNPFGNSTGIGELSGGVYYLAGGGSGAAESNSAVAQGGLGGGGVGGRQNSDLAAGVGAPNTGGGGGGDDPQAGGAGGSGVVIVRYLNAAAPANTVLPTVPSSPNKGVALTGVAGTWTGEPAPTLTYQWQVAAAATGATWTSATGAGATSLNYTVASADVDKYLRLTVTGTSTSGVTTASSAVSSMVTDKPINTVLPVISGAGTSGSVLNVSSGTWTGAAPIAYSYQWQISNDGSTGWANASGSGSASNAYAVAAGDGGKYLRVTVGALNSYGSGSPVTTTSLQAPVAPANTVAPVIAGTTTPGSVLLATAGTWTGTPTAYSYQWQHCDLSGSQCTNVGTNSASYTLVNADAAYTIKVQVTGSNVAGSASASSAATSAIASASGCTITTSGGYTIHSCTTTGSSTINTYRTLSADYLVVGGGGGGSPGMSNVGGGGGGAGGLLFGSAPSLVSGSYAVTVGSGGNQQSNGGSSSFISSTALGGAGALFNSATANTGGSGAGGQGTNKPAGAGTAGQGNAGSIGGNGNVGYTVANGGGGGGAGTAGGSNADATIGGAAGAGSSSSISGSSVIYAAGGAGSGYPGSAAGANGVRGGGGSGGGGGGGGAGGAGGSGVVVVRYKTAAAPANTVLPTISSANGVMTGTNGTWTGEPAPTYTYQWQVASAATGATWTSATGSGATSLNYTPASADIGQYLRLTVTGTSTSGVATASSAASGQIATPANTVAPAIAGTTTPGSVLLATAGIWTGTPTAYSYQWQRCDLSGNRCTDIGTNSSSYTLANADATYTIKVQVTGSNVAGSAAASSAITSAVASASGCTVTTSGLYTIHSCTTTGSNTLNTYRTLSADYLVVAGGGGGGMDMGGGGGGGGFVDGSQSLTGGTTYNINVGTGGTGAPAACTGAQPCVHSFTQTGSNGGNSSLSGGSLSAVTAIGGGRGGTSYYTSPYAFSAGASGGSGGGASGYSNDNTYRSGGSGTSSQGYAGGQGGPSYYSGGGGGAGGAGTNSTNIAHGGPGKASSILGTEYYFAGGGGGSGYTICGGNGGIGGGGGGAVCSSLGGGSALNSGAVGGYPGVYTCGSCHGNAPGGNAGANTGGGGGGGSHYSATNQGGNGGSGIVIVRYKTPAAPANTALPTISSANGVMTGTSGTWTGEPAPTYTYQWQVASAATGATWTSATGAGATTSSYTPASADIGQYLRLTVTGTSTSGVATASSAASGQIATPANTAVPTISGTTTPGQALTAAAGTWTGTPTTYAYQWQRCDLSGNRCTDIGTNSSTYTLANADATYTIKVQVTGSNVAGSAAASSALTSAIASASGCTVTTSGLYTIHSCTTTGSSTINTYRTLSTDYLVIGGGGGGGGYVGGGGGAGGFVEGSQSLIAGSYPITVGAGGANEVSGGNSTGFSKTALGGGAGSRFPNNAGVAGGSGGGAGGPEGGLPAGGAATQPSSASGGYGNRGGNVTGVRTGTPTQGMGGGGAGNNGQDASANITSSGGAGRASSITGTSYSYSGGGGGGGFYNNGGSGGSGGGGGGGAHSAAGGAGGTGGTGNGSAGSPTGEGPGGAGAPNTGGGGGGTGHSQASAGGGSGIVIVRYKTAAAPVNTALPTVPGAVNNGSVLTGNAGTWTGEPTPALTYQWQVASAATGATWTSATGSGATSLSYTPVSADIGQYLRLTVTGTSTSGIASASSAASSMVTDKPINTVLPGVSGVANVGSSLTSDSGTWTGAAPISYAYQWQVQQVSSTILATTGAAPWGIAVDSAGNIYTANIDSNNVSKITPAGVSTILGTTGDFPVAITVDSAGNVYTVNTGSQNVSKITPAGTSTILATTTGSPSAIAVDSAGNIYTANTGSSNVSKITPSGVSSILGTTGTRPRAITVDSAGNVYTANTDSSNVSKITPAGVSTILGSTDFSPWGIAVDSAGNVYTTHPGPNSVSKITPAGVSITNWAATASTSYSIAADSAGNVYTANTGTNNVSKITPAGVSTVLATTGTNPRAVTVDAAGNVYTANMDSNNVSKITQWASATGAGSTTSSYVPAASDSGKTLRSQVTASNSYGSTVAYSTGTSVNVAPANSVVPVIAGTTTPGSTLTATSGTWTGSPTPAYSYQWQRCDLNGSQCASIGTNSTSYTLVNADAAYTIKMQVTASNAAGSASASSALTSAVASASGCTVTASGGYTIHSCTTTGSNTLNTYRTLSADYLVVGGGGGGGSFGGGGGAGGMLTGSQSVAAGSYAVTVGDGGAGQGTSDVGVNGINGANSIFAGSSTITAIGGGGGGSRAGAPGYVSKAGNSGGSGGGSSSGDTGTQPTVAAGTSGQGSAGGQGMIGAYIHGGGGGASQAGANGVTGSPGKGGDGLASSISGSSVTYAGGGGAGSIYQTATVGAGGSGGGGSGGWSGGFIGTPNRGGGGGGGSYTAGGGKGGSGIVIVRYQTAAAPANTVLPTISGTANKGNVLTGNAGTWTGEPTPDLTYQWQVAAAATGATWSSATGSGATSLSYTVASADAGKYLRLTVTGTSTSGVTSASSAASAMATDPPVSATVPSIAGTATVGSTLTSDSGTWTGAAPISYAYQWQVSSSGILGTTGALPFGTTIDSSGNIYTANYNANTVTKLTPAGVSSSLSYMGDFGTQPWGITVDSSGNIYTANRTSSNITKITPAGSASTFASALGSPVAITIDSNGNLYTANYDLNQVTKITPAGAATTLASTGTGPYAVAVDSAGNVYTPNYGSNNVTKITPAGVSTILGTTGTNPRGIALDAAGNVYTVNGSSNTVTKITPAGVSTTLGATGANPRDIKLDSAGNVYTANYSANTVTKITPAGVSTTMGATGTSPNSMALDSAGNVYTANSGSNNVTKIAPWTNATGPGATTSSYVPAASDAGKILRSQVTATNSYGSAIAYSPDTAAITYTPANTVPPAISPSGANLIATSGTWTGFPTPTYAYQWQVSSDGSTAWTAAAGAGSNTNTYTPAASDASKYLRVAVTGTNALGSAVASSSSLGLDRFTLPTLAWNSTPATPVATGTATATGTWTSGGGLATLQCQTGSGAWVSCDSATTHTWTLGAAGSDTVLNVRAVNSAGTSATLTRTVHRNHAAPTVSISSAPPHYYIQTGTYNYTTAGAGSCSWVLNNAPWSGSISAAGSCTAAGGAIALSAAQRGGQGWRRMTITVTNADGSASASTTNDWYSGPSEVPNGDFQTGALAPYWTDVSSSYSGTGSVSLSNSNTWQLAITSTNSTYWNAVWGGSHYNRCDNIYWESAVNNYTQANYTYVGSYYSAPSYYAGYYVAGTYTAATAYAPASYSPGSYSASSYYAGAYSAPYSYVSSYSQVRAGAAGFRLWYWGANTWNLYYDWLDYEGSNTMLSHAAGGSQFCGVNRVMTMMGRSTTSGQSGTSYFDNVRGQNAG
jgi:type II secretory pathway pseudopilin PulG